jgi:hypothetical protein
MILKDVAKQAIFEALGRQANPLPRRCQAEKPPSIFRVAR